MVPDKNEVLNSIFSGVDKTDFNSLRMSTDTLKGPVAFPDFNLEISFSISSVVVGYTKKESQTGLCKYSTEDFSTIGIDLVKSLPMLEKYVLKAFATSIGLAIFPSFTLSSICFTHTLGARSIVSSYFPVKGVK